MYIDYTEQAAIWAEQYGRMVYTTAYRILGNPQDAEDVLQEVFLKLLKQRIGFHNGKPLKHMGAYLRVMASHCAVDFLRRKPKWQPETPDDTPTAPADQNPQQTADRRQMAQRLQQALRSLPGREAEIFALRYFEEMAYEEIAAQMQLSVNQVGVILHRTRNRLQEMLQPLVEPDNRVSTPIASDAPLRKENCRV